MTRLIHTLTLNTGFDQTLVIPSFQPGMIRAVDHALGMAGKPTDASYILGQLGIPSRAMGLLAGANGKRVEEMLLAAGVQTDFLWVKGESRCNIVLICQDTQTETTITPATMIIEAADLAALRQRIQQALPGAACLVLGGAMPPGIDPEYYCDIITLCREAGVPAILDSSGPGLAAGVKSQPAFIKPNIHELSELVGSPLHSREDALLAARQVNAQFGCGVVCTLGREGALVITHDQTLKVIAPSVPVASSAGAGDAMLAGIAYSYTQDRTLADGLRFGAAAAAAVVSSLGTAVCPPEIFSQMLPRVLVEPLLD